jgi:hypothetical protein
MFLKVFIVIYKYIKKTIYDLERVLDKITGGEEFI